MAGETVFPSGFRPVSADLSSRRRGNLSLRHFLLEIDGPIPAQAGEPSPMRASSRTSGAYPRAGGGTHANAAIKVGRMGPIPAQAGEPLAPVARRVHARAYPRAGGGTASTRSPTLRSSGLSPRRRGNHAGRHLEAAHHGPIPAQAGEPISAMADAGTPRAYPRAGGGTDIGHGGCGHTEGLSPRRRGNHECRLGRLVDHGPIPAQAGEPSTSTRTSAGARAYPRAGGGTGEIGDLVRCPEGLSPRRRGNPVGGLAELAPLGPIPAQAGEPRSRRCRPRESRAYPRAGGGTEYSAALPASTTGLSPRRRGNLR